VVTASVAPLRTFEQGDGEPTAAPDEVTGSDRADGKLRNALTPTGVAMSAGAVVLLVAGTVLDYPELVVPGLAALLSLLVAAIWMLARPDVEAVRTISPARVAPGDEARGTLAMTNVGPRRSPPILAAELVGDARVPIALPSLARGDSHVASYQLPTSRRGVYPVGPLTVGHSDPLRLMSVRRRYASRATLVVYPTIHPVAPLPTGRARDMDGATSSTAPRGGVAFHSLRGYVRGDDLRLVHWPSTARVGTLMVRHNVVPNEPRLLVVLDTSAAAYTGESFEDAARVAASLCLAGYHRGFPVELRTTRGEAAWAHRGLAGPEAVLDALAAADPRADDTGLPALLRLLPHEDGIALGVVTGRPPAAALATVAVAEPRFVMTTLVQVGDRSGHPPAELRGVFTLDVGTSLDFASAWNALMAT
jgi:uncharacterized protein (DUF58 family)